MTVACAASRAAAAFDLEAIETAREFGLRLYREAWRRGWSQAQKKGVIGDGALWIWNLAHLHFPGAIEIVDLYHAHQTLGELSAKLFGADGEERQGWLARTRESLDSGRIEARVGRTRGANFPWPRLRQLRGQ